ncbi:MAG: hypothetical protein Q7R83_00010 [bacterium]|nr:hypothetical protein [bacterium]
MVFIVYSSSRSQQLRKEHLPQLRIWSSCVRICPPAILGVSTFRGNNNALLAIGTHKEGSPIKLEGEIARGIYIFRRHHDTPDDWMRFPLVHILRSTHSHCLLMSRQSAAGEEGETADDEKYSGKRRNRHKLSS